MTFKTKWPLLGLIIGVMAVGCDKDDDPQDCLPCDDPTNPDCPNYDPCIGENPVTAEFRIFDEIFSGGPEAGTWFEEDVIWDGRVKFSAIEQDAYYKWYLGQEVVEGFGDSSVIRTTVNLNPGIYTASLVVEKDPNLTCFPTDSGRDSTFRTFEVKNVCDLLIMNKFKGVFEHAQMDSVVIEFFPADFGPGNQGWVYSCDPFYRMIGVNLSGSGDSLEFGPTGSTTAVLNRFWKSIGSFGISPNGYFEVFPDLTCRGEYQIIEQDYIFTGKLIQ
jgi:hypothetical protein